MVTDKVIVRFFSRSIHCAQLFTGISLLAKRSAVRCCFENHINDPQYPFKTAIAEIIYKGKVLTFDMLDGYNNLEAIKWYYSHSDFYFKRSFSTEKNNLIGFDTNKIFPWGFNYHVSYIGNPCEGPVKAALKDFAKVCLRKETNGYYTKSVFEEYPLYKKDGIRILFYTRLWPQENTLSDDLNEERERINNQRIILIRNLQRLFGESFHGGLEQSTLATQLAPDLCLGPEMTRRKNYLSLMHQCDICVATTGLHNSIGWKMGEYVAAAKGIVSEPLNYIVPGIFERGLNYLEFSSLDNCVASIQALYENPQQLYEMKLRNYHYYQSYLEPSRMVENCLRFVDQHL